MPPRARSRTVPSNHQYRPPSVRPLLVYAFDPTLGRKLSNYMTVAVPYEKVRPGPIGKSIAVIDYDASNQCYYEPIDLNHPSVAISGGLQPSESDPRFHQQMVYTVASETVRRCEFALGRPIRWRPRPGSKRDDPFHGKLRIFPHAFQQANAFYDPGLCALCFGYFQASADDAGDNLPGQTIFTCLSHDIIAHETTHAIVDSIRGYFSQASGLDTPAFHEAFADIVALLQHFSMEDAVQDTINRTGGLIYRSEIAPEIAPANGKAAIIPELSEDNPLVGLARQFGHSIGMRSALRSAIGCPPNSRDLETVTEPHLRGAILVAAVFDAYFTVYIKRTRDLMRIGRASGAVGGSGELHPDLARRLAGEASKIASQFLTICVRAIDYCPPVDITFGEFLRAVITADSDLLPDDPHGYRAEIIKAFRLRGIIPEGVGSYSEEALRWYSPELWGEPLPRCRGLIYDVLEDDDPEDQLRREILARKNAATLTRYAQVNAASLGLRFKREGGAGIHAHSFHPIHRIAPDGHLVVDFVAEFLQSRSEPLDPSDHGAPSFQFRGGATVIFDHHGAVRYVIAKSIGNKKRLEAQRAFHLSAAQSMAAAPYDDRLRLASLNFAAVHRGY